MKRLIGPLLVAIVLSGLLAAPQQARAQPATTCMGQLVTIDMGSGASGIGTNATDVILGTDGADVIDGRGGNDLICSGSGDDVVFGGDGADTIFGQGGSDIVRGNSGADVINGGPGNDRLYGGTGDDEMSGGDGDDYLGGFGGDDTINGGPGRETIFGGFGSDTINGGSGNDTINGLIGNDKISGGAGNDTINGDRGNDIINGGGGDDTINGGNANDTLRGGDGDDIVSGGRADDSLSGGDGNDVCVGNRQIVADTTDGSCETTFGVERASTPTSTPTTVSPTATPTTAPPAATPTTVPPTATPTTVPPTATPTTVSPAATPTTVPPTATPTTVPPSSGRFETLPVGAALPSGAECAALVRPMPEIRPENAVANANRGSRANANNRNDWAQYDRVDGDFAGTTDEIIQWAACKWGIDEDIVRAQVIKESYWYQSANGDNGQSWGLGQVRDTAHPSAFEFSINARNSSAYNLDYTYGVWRACYEGIPTWLNNVEHNGVYGPGDVWGCLGVWFSGRWYVNNDDYLNKPGDSVRFHYENRTWESPVFING